jgi:formylglycine-generating enzyme required for sulfatase activity
MDKLIDGEGPYLLQKRSKDEMADYDAGFQAGLGGEEFDDTQNEAWQRGWADARGVPKRVMRGGSFLCTDQYCSRYMVGTRGKGEASTGTNHLGFRCVKTIPHM